MGGGKPGNVETCGNLKPGETWDSIRKSEFIETNCLLSLLIFRCLGSRESWRRAFPTT
jgi:hypothetical protein